MAGQEIIMIQSTSSDRLLRLAPLVLRSGVAAILIYNGFGQLSGLFGAETGQSLLTDAQGISLTANWETVLGAAEMAVGGLLAIGFFTRLTSLVVLSGVGYCVYASMGAPAPDVVVATAHEAINQAAPASAELATESAVGLATQLFQSSAATILLLAAACGSLFVSGAGCFSLDTRHARRTNAETATAQL